MANYNAGKGALKRAHEGRIATRCEHEVWRFWNNVMDGVAPMTPIEYEPLDDYAVDPEQENAVMAQEAKAWVRAGLETITTRLKKVVVGRIAQEKTFSIVAKELGISITRAQHLEHCAMRRLRATSPERRFAAWSLLGYRQSHE